MDVLTVVGARPQFIKAFPVSRALRDAHREILVHTGQHYDEKLSDVFFDELDVPSPAHDLGIGSAPPGVQIGRMAAELQPIVDDEAPDVILTYGDTNSTLAAAVVGGHADALLAHVEAGLRSHAREMPEETNRVLTDHAADLLFAPTERAVRALDREGITAGVHHTGDVMVDALRWARQVARHRSDVCTSFPFGREEYVVATIHRELNTDHLDRLRAIISGLGRLELPVVLPMHPRTRQRLEQAGAYGWAAERVHVIDPVGYFAFVDLLASAARVVTDSGGVQKEAFLLDTPCVTIREETEWPETVDAGWNTLADADPDVIQEAVTAPVLIEDKPQPFGDGTAAQTIRRRLEEAIEDGIGIRDGSLEPFEAADYQRGN